MRSDRSRATTIEAASRADNPTSTASSNTTLAKTSSSLAVTYVAVVEARVAGFATVAASSLERANLPSARLRKRMPAYPLPVLRLARLGVDTRAQGLGIGRALLRHVLALAVQQRDRIGCVGVVADAKPRAVSFYEGLGFVPIEGVREGRLHGDPTPMFLAIDTIAPLVGA